MAKIVEPGDDLGADAKMRDWPDPERGAGSDRDRLLKGDADWAEGGESFETGAGDRVEEAPTGASAPGLHRVQISTTALPDAPTAEDALGFAPYVRAVAWFLLNRRTVPPLTLSVEGPWGSGKSSFMLQVRSLLDAAIAAARKQPATGDRAEVRDYKTVSFNPWRSDKDEALWAAFALAFMEELNRVVSLWRRLRANLHLQWSRFDWTRGKWQVMQLAGFAVLVVVLTIGGLLGWAGHVGLPGAEKGVAVASVAGASWLAVVTAAIAKARRVFGNPLRRDLARYVRNPGYEEKVAFIERFQRDFTAMVRSYVGAKGRVYVFIDDLDRCEVPKAADLMQAINLLLSTNDTNLIFVLGLDREIVAAGLAAKYERLLPYLAEARIPRAADPRKDARTGLEYGYSFLEKFIQVPFHVPVPGNDDIGQWVSRLTAPDGGSRSEAAPPAADQTPQQEAFALAAGSDPEGFEAVVVKMAMVLDFNPRRIKQFVNVFRLWVSIAVQTGLLVPAGKTGANAEPAGMRIEQLGVFTAIILRWPGLAADLSQRPDLLERLIGVASGENAGEDPLLAYWASRDRLTAALRLAPPYSLRAIGVLPLLSILPNTYRGEMDFTAVTAAPARLVPGASFAAGAASAASSADVGVDGGGSSPSPAA